jgi:hypothetical protein
VRSRSVGGVIAATIVAVVLPAADVPDPTVA